MDPETSKQLNRDSMALVLRRTDLLVKQSSIVPMQGLLVFIGDLFTVDITSLFLNVLTTSTSNGTAASTSRQL